MQDQNDLLPWIEKYRPEKIEQLSSQEEAVSLLKRSVTGNQMPHLLFYGPPGTGKTSLIMAYCKQIFKQEYRSRVMELNASDERGINVIREKIKNFCKVLTSKKEDMPDYKVVILDEADMLTKDAQAALRRIIELYSASTRFCLICNYVTKIILPIVSRCAKFRFKSIPVKDGVNRMKHIASSENMKISEQCIEEIFKSCSGDLRKAIQYLQSLKTFKKDQTITEKDVFEIIGRVETLEIENLVETLMASNNTTPSSKQIMEKIETILQKGYSAKTIIEELHNKIVVNSSQLAVDKNMEVLVPRLALCFSEADVAVCEGSDEFLQLLNLSLTITKLCSAEEINTSAA